MGLMLLAIEGLDGSGKGEMVRYLSQRFGMRVVAFPTPYTEQLHAYLRGEMAVRPKALFLLFLYDILQYVPEEGLLDRYVFSTIAYDKAFSYERAKEIVEALQPPKPKAVIYIRVGVETALKRSKGEHIYDKDREVQERVKERYERMAEENFLTKWYVVNGEQSLEGMLKEGERIVERLMSHEGGPSR